MRIGFSAFWMQKAGNASEEYEDAFAPAQCVDEEIGEFRCAIADGATETSFSGLWAQLLVDAFVTERLPRIKPETLALLSSDWQQSIAVRTQDKPLPWYALEKLERGAFSSLLGLAIRADGSWRALCVGDSCLFHIRPRQAIRAFPYHTPEQFNNHPLLLSTRMDASASIGGLAARGKWQPNDSFLLMTDALAHYFLSQRDLRARLVAEPLDQDSFAQLVESARAERLCRNDDVTLLKIALGGGQGGMA